ncbi:hypothetical protein GW17_00038527 [Ensete ventricosum]|nr:hypothetical protein GW17_00038527 [Ensete ventricosum]
MPKPSPPYIAIRAPAPKKLIRDELREQSAKGLCWYCDEPWSREYHYKKGWLLVIKQVEDEDIKLSEENLEPEDEDTEEKPQSADFMVHALAGYSNPQTMKVGGLLKQQPITVLIDTGSTNIFLNSKVAARMTLQIEGYDKFNVKGWPRLSPYIKSMHLGTRQECVGSSPRVSRVCQDGAREFAKRRPRLDERLSMVAEKLAGNDGPRQSQASGRVRTMRWDLVRSSLGDSPKESGSSLGTRREIARKKTEGLTARLLEVAGVCGRFDLHPKKIGSGCRCASRRRTRK